MGGGLFDAGGAMAFPFRWFGSAVALMTCAVMAAGPAWAQFDKKPPVSPVAPPTTKAPVFDTRTPEYNPPPTQKAAGTVVAEVDGRPITLGDVADSIKDLPAGMQNLPYDELFPLALDRLITKQALVIQAQHRGIDADPVVKRRLKAAADEVLAKELIKARAAQEIPEKALLDRYAKEYAGKPGPDEVNLRIIAVNTEADAKAIIKQLQGGADFATVAQQSSVDTTASVGGQVGWVTRTDLNPELGGAAFATQPGQVVASPIFSNGKWFVLKIEGRRARPTPPFAAVREELERALVQERAAEWTKEALAGIKVRVFTIAGQEIQELPPETPASEAK